MMVTCRELVDELSRIAVTFISWVYAGGMALYLALRLMVGDRTGGLLAAANAVAPYLFLPLALLVPLGLITRAKWGLLATLPLVVVAAAWLGARYFDKAEVVPSGPVLRLITFNVYFRNQDVAGVESWLNAQDADLVLLQEIPQASILPLLYRQSERYPHQHARFSLGRFAGNAVLSRYPILAWESLNDPAERSAYLMDRYLVEIRGRTIAVYNLDMPVPVDWSRMGGSAGISAVFALMSSYDDRVRNARIDRFLERLAAETEPVIAAGDFNLSDYALKYDDIFARLHDTYRTVGSGAGATWPANARENTLLDRLPPLLRMDYVWHSDHFRAVEAAVGPELASDHRPMLATLEIVGEPSS